ncbi:MAG: agmatine deiminase family protein [Deltaproteobacteria bacterium]|nr:agmatine deiminase family protein [Deltaproteobacteria bacterium]
MKTPQQSDYRMPAEWELHEATWLSWPHNIETWPGKMEPIPGVWVEMIRHLTTGEKIHLNVNDEKMEKEAQGLLKKADVDLKKVIFHRIVTDDCWMRDCGPIFVVKNPPQSPFFKGGGNQSPPLAKGGEGGFDKESLAITNWKFNKWGGKYPPWELDNAVPEKIEKELDIPAFKIDMVLEGGSIDVNGKGTLLTTEQCLLNKNRNPHLIKDQIEQYLKDCLGISHVLWLGDGITGDDTDGHIDDIARFVNPTTVVTAVEENPHDENYKILQDNLKRLQRMKDQNGNPLKIIPLPMPGAVYYEGQRLPASYANFYIANKVVLLPTYHHANDDRARAILQDFFPDRKVVGINATDFVWGLGAFHCVTQQQPAI